MDDRIKETLIIDTWSSECGNCGKGAATNQIKHDRELGYGVKGNGEPCGVKFKYVSTHYMGPLQDQVRLSRPDLEYVDFRELQSGS
jgi:hypothetical protein